CALTNLRVGDGSVCNPFGVDTLLVIQNRLAVFPSYTEPVQTSICIDIPYGDPFCRDILVVKDLQTIPCNGQVAVISCNPHAARINRTGYNFVGDQANDLRICDTSVCNLHFVNRSGTYNGSVNERVLDTRINGRNHGCL